MSLVGLIKALIDILDETGDCAVYITTANESQLYNGLLMHYLEAGDYIPNPVLRLEGVMNDDEEEEEEL